jgi:hypothetical protein
MIGRAAIGLSLDLMKSNITKTGEHLAKPTVIDRVEAVNHLTWAMERRTIRVVWKRVLIIPIISKEFIL